MNTSHSSFQHKSSRKALSKCPQTALPVTRSHLVFLICFARVGIGAKFSCTPPNLISLSRTRGLKDHCLHTQEHCGGTTAATAL